MPLPISLIPSCSRQQISKHTAMGNPQAWGLQSAACVAQAAYLKSPPLWVHVGGEGGPDMRRAAKNLRAARRGAGFLL